MQSLQKYFVLSEEEKQTLWAQYGKDRNNVKEDVQILRDWLKKEQHIPEIEDDLFLENLLIRNKCRIEKTKIKIDNYFASKNVYSDFFEGLDPCTDTMSNSLKYHHFCYLPTLSPNNERLVYWMMNLPSDDYFDHTNCLRYCAILFETQLELDTVDKVAIIADAKGFTMSFARKYDLVTMSKVVKTFYDGFSGRFSAMHFINVSPAIEIMANFLKTILQAKLRDRIYLHKNAEALHKYFPQDCLPTEASGSSGISAVDLAKKTAASIQEEREAVLRRNKRGTNESLRIGKPYIQVDLYGMEGTFKKINLD